MRGTMNFGDRTCFLSGRAARRQQERNLSYDANIRAKQIIERNAKLNAAKAKLEQNGITVEQLNKNYELGRKKASEEFAAYGMPMFYSACAIALKREFKFGEGRIIKALDAIQQIMTEEICTTDIIERCKTETGLDIFADEYN